MPVTDLADCTATELLSLYRARAGLAGRGDAGGAGAHRPPEPAPARLLPCRARRRAGQRARQRGTLAARRARRRARRRAGLGQGPDAGQGLADAARQPHGRPDPDLGRRRAGDGAAARSRRGAAGQDLDAGVRLQGRDQFAADRAARATPGTRRRPRAARPVAARWRWPRAWGRCRSAPTAPAACASRRRSAATSATSRASAACRPTPCRPSAPWRIWARTR